MMDQQLLLLVIGCLSGLTGFILALILERRRYKRL